MSERTELRLDESNDVFFKVSVFGAERAPKSIRMVCEAGDIAYSFAGKTINGEDGIVCFVVPPMKNVLKAGLYEARVEVIVDDHYFVPLKFQAQFQQPLEVIAETVVAKTPERADARPKVDVQIRSVPREKHQSLREKYRLIQDKK